MEFKLVHGLTPSTVPPAMMAETDKVVESTGRLSAGQDSSAVRLSTRGGWSKPRYTRWLLLCLAMLLGVNATGARAEQDNESTTPTAWWIYTGQSFNDVNNTINSKNARIEDIAVDNAAANSFTVTYIQNTGAYAKQWWWYVGIDAPTLASHLSANKARLVSLKAYDIGGGNIRFAVAMIANTGADNKAWWYYYGKSTADIFSLAKTNNARVTAVQSYTSNGQTVYACIMIANTGADAKPWWFYYNISPQTVGADLTTNKARLLDLTPAGNGNFNAAMESCSGACPAWWWYYGLDAYGVLDKAQNGGARVVTASSYQGCNNGTNECYVTTMIGNSPPDVTACDSQGCISEAKLSANICGTLANHTVGYSCEVGSLPTAYGGLARTSTDAPRLSMTPDLVTDIASVSKTMTATAILQLLTKDGLTIDTKISPYLYSDWKQGTNIDQLTFKELLTHSTGFGQLPNNACGNGITYSALEAIVAGGVSSSNIGKPDYGNCNFALLREIMPALLHQPLTNVPDGSQRAQQSSTLYINYMNAHVFGPVSVPTSSCTPPSGGNGILSYPYPAGIAAGTDWGDWSMQCGAGGWVLSGDQIFRVVNDLANGNTLLTPAEKKQMFSDCLGWDCAVRSDCPDPNVCKNGHLVNGSTSVWTYAGVLKCNVPVVVVVNSPLPAPFQSGEDIIGVVTNALKNSTVPGAAKPCP